MRGNLTVEKVSYSRQRERPVGRNWATQGLCFDLGKRGEVHVEALRREVPGDGAIKEGPRTLQEGLVSFSCLCKREGNNVILDVGSRIPLRERICLFKRKL